MKTLQGIRNALVIVIAVTVVSLVGSVYAQDVAVDLTLPNLQGEQVSLSDFKGEQNVLLVFGSTWCPYCVKEIPDLNELHEELGGEGLKILSVYVNERKSKVASFTKKKGVRYEVLVDMRGDAAKEYGVRGIPAIFFIDKEGTIQYSVTGRFDMEKVRELVQG